MNVCNPNVYIHHVVIIIIISLSLRLKSNTSLPKTVRQQSMSEYIVFEKQ